VVDTRLIDLYLLGSTTILMAVLLVRLVAIGLWRVYAWFAAYLAVLCIESVLLQVLNAQPLYIVRSVWLVTRPVSALLECMVVLTIFGRWTVSFPGIGAFGRKLVVVILIVAAVVAASTIPVAWPPGAWMQAVKLTLIATRAVNIGFSLFLLLTLVFFRKFGGPVAPNLRRHTWAMAAYVTATSASYFVATASGLLGKQTLVVSNILLPAVTLTALTFWIFAFKRAGETQPDTVGDESQWEEAEEMNRHMQRLADVITLTPGGMKRAK